MAVMVRCASYSYTVRDVLMYDDCSISYRVLAWESGVSVQNHSWRWFQFVCTTVLQIQVGHLRCSLHFYPRPWQVWLGFPEACQCTWTRMKVVQALPVACHVCVPNMRGCGWWREFTGSVLGQSVQQSHVTAAVLPNTLSLAEVYLFHALDFWNYIIWICLCVV